MINRGRLPRAVQEEFEHLISRLRGFLSQSFDEDGQLIVADPNLAVATPGFINPYAGTTPPAGWLLCDGTQVNRQRYKSLFDVIGTTYGAGDGSTTFNLPDLRQRFLLGKAAAGTGAALGATGGAIDHTHTGPSHTHTTPAHTHTFDVLSSTNGDHSHTVNSHQHSIGNHTHTYSGLTGSNNGGDGPAQSGSGVSIPASSPHDHTFSGTTSSNGSGLTGTASPGTDSQGNHQHEVFGTSDSGGSGTTGSGGTGDTSAANPPYAVVNYLIFSGV